MLEITLLTLFVGSLGVQATALGGWMRWYQSVVEKEEEEDETLTRYESKINTEMEMLGQSNHISPQGVQQGIPRELRLTGWEFKIIRASRDIFRDPAVLQRLCEEEGEAGWILLEKLDDRRVRFKRPVALRDLIKPERLAIDPYRTQYGPSNKPLVILGMLAALGVIIVPAYLAFSLVSNTLHNSSKNLPQPAGFSTPKPVEPVD
ncbi:MAG TPA: hypothetical protein VIQ31_28990 [Phormidium sp.]